MLNKFEISLKGVLITFICSAIVLFGGFLSLQNPSGTMFTRVDVSSSEPIQVWRKSVKDNTHEFLREPSEENTYFSDNSISKIYIGIYDNSTAANIELSFEGKSTDKISLDTIKSEWKKVTLPMEEIRRSRAEEDMDKYLAGVSFYEAPSSYGHHSIASLVKPALNWGFKFGVFELFKLTFYSLVLTLVFVYIRAITITENSEKKTFLIRYLFPVLGFIFSVLLIFKYGVDIFWMDALAFPYFLKSIEAGEMSWQLFWNQHNEHRIVLVRAMFYLLSRFSNINMLVLPVLNQLMVLIGVIYFIKRTNGLNAVDKIVTSLIISLAFFSPANIENTILPFHGQWHGTVFGMLLVASVVGNQNFFMKSLIFWVGFFAAYASMPPWVCIPVAILLGLVLRQTTPTLEKISKNEAIHFVSFGVITLLLFAYYMHDWQRVSVSPIDGIYKDPIKFITFFLQLAGNQLLNEKLALLGGVIICSLSFMLIYLRRLGKVIIPETLVCLMMLSLTWCFVTAVGRSTNGSAILPRYVFISTGLWAATLSAYWINRKVFSRFLLPAFVVASLGLVSLQSLKGFSDGSRFYRIINRDAKLLKKAMTTKDSIHIQHSNIISIFDLKGNKEHRDHVYELFDFLQRKGYWTILK
ncbi:hypothetical protein [Halobacteriovorax sp. HLS]|uniref:hypothetical protein n=1 Tax=Halobacteriovorax sp. HLS TaxID=2234000 RepID=UPI000FDCDDBD|nr:hypothetical protein [Halobacteriovorax sp. HLS]